MKTIGTFSLVIIITVCNALLNGWFWMMGYKLGITPLINYLDVAPAIPYLYFVLLCLTWSLMKGKNLNYDDAPKVTEAKFWTRYIGVVLTDFMILGILYIFNLCIC
jgi:hypothetical protein